MVTAIGPQGPNYTTTRPADDADVSGGIDTWAQDCSAAGAFDGTIMTASFFNVIIAQLREAIRGAGITLDNADDTMLWKAIQSIGVTVTASGVAPAAPKLGDLWYNTNDSVLYTRIYDGAANIWLDASN